MPERIVRHEDLDVYKRAFLVSMRIFQASKRFPKEETYSLTDQIRRSSRSVCANLAEAWRKRRYPASFLSKLSDAEAEAAETQVWIKFAVESGYLDSDLAFEFHADYEAIIRTLVGMVNNSESWTFPGRK